jgi:diguanylate cyclase (GGDEF)-like protein
MSPHPPSGMPRHGSSSGSRPWWLLPGLWLFVAVLPYPFLPEGVQWRLYLVTSAGAVVALLVGLWLYRPSAPAPWRLITAASAFFFLGDLLTSVHLDADGMPIGPWSDLAYLAFYPLVFAALVLLMRRGADRDVSAWLDAVIWTVGAGVLAWEWVFEDTGLGDDLTLVRVITAAYPLMDLLLLLVLLRVAFTAARTNSALLLLAAGLAAQLVTDMVYLGGVLGDSYAAGGLMDLGWLFSYVAVAAAGLHPSMAESAVIRTRRHDGKLGGWRIPLLLVPALAAPGVLLALILSGSISGEVDDVVMATAAVFLVLVLAAARGSGLVRLANRRADDLQVRVDHDSLTGLVSRDGFAERLAGAVDDDVAADDPWSVVFLDLDDFKSVNDLQGHVAGDQLLVEVASRLRDCAGDGEVVSRFGGDEFAVLVRTSAVEPLVTRVLATFEEPVWLHGRHVYVSVSIGSAVATPGLSAVEVMRCVDVAMYDAKRSDRSWAPYHPEMSQQLLSARDNRERVAKAVADREVAPWFQPVVDLETGELEGFEALARWVAADGTMTPPDEWLPLAEATDLIVEVDRQMMCAAVGRLARWREQYGAVDLTMAVNLSGRTLHVTGIEDEILDVLLDAGVPYDRLVVEVTEGVQIQDDEVGARLQRLRARGVRIALDDFGTGWSSLSYLRRFPVDLLKLDRSFTHEVGESADTAAIPAAVVQLAGALGLGIVAEGVETMAQRAALLGLGFRLCQGYLYSPARPAEDLDQWVIQAQGVRVPLESMPR